MLDKVSEVLTKLRVVSTALILFVSWLLLCMWDFYTENHTTMELASSGAFSMAWLALIGILGKCLNHLLEKNYKDE